MRDLLKSLADDTPDLADVVSGRVPGRTNSEERVVFLNPVGTGAAIRRRGQTHPLGSREAEDGRTAADGLVYGRHASLSALGAEARRLLQPLDALLRLLSISEAFSR